MNWRLLRLLVALAALTALFGLVSPKAVLAAFARAEPAWLVAAMFLLALSTIVGTFSFQAILAARGVRVRFAEVLSTDLAGHFYALSLPAGIATGAAIRVVRLAHDRAPVPTLLGAILASRLIDVAACALLALFALPWLLPVLGQAAWFWALVAGGISVLALLAYAAAHSRQLRLILARRVVPHLPGSPRFRRRVRRVLRRLGGSGGRLGPLGHLLPAACALLRHLLGGAAILAAAHAFATDLPYAATLWVRALATIAILLPVSVAGLGVQEASFVLLMSPFGVAPADAFAMSLVVLAFRLLLAGAGGILELFDSLKSLRRPPANAAPAHRSRPPA